MSKAMLSLPAAASEHSLLAKTFGVPEFRSDPEFPLFL